MVVLVLGGSESESPPEPMSDTRIPLCLFRHLARVLRYGSVSASHPHRRPMGRYQLVGLCQCRLVRLQRALGWVALNKAPHNSSTR